MTANEVTPRKSARIALLPLGATEQHGPHLPLETDTIIASRLAEKLLDRLPDRQTIELLPVEPVGYSPEHMDYSGSLTLGYQEAIERWVAIGEECARRGISKFVMLNAHGGNSPLMTIVATELRVRHKMLAVATSWTRFGYPADIVTPQERAIGIHGGLIETSVILALRPDLVAMDKAHDFSSAQTAFAKEFAHLRAYGPHAFGWKMNDLSAPGVVGNAAGATAEAGEKIIAHALDGLCELIADVDRFDLSRLA